jgi:hypothetical protein
MVLWNILDGGLSHSRPILWQVIRCWVIWIFLICYEFAKYSVEEPSTLTQNH